MAPLPANHAAPQERAHYAIYYAARASNRTNPISAVPRSGSKSARAPASTLALDEHGIDGLDKILKFMHALVAISIDKECWSAIHPATHATEKLRFDYRCKFAALKS